MQSPEQADVGGTLPDGPIPTTEGT
jgi:hypothetical protein